MVVNVERKVKHPLYGKIIRRSKKYHAHDEGNEFKAGETVRIEEIAPVSKLKTWKVLDRVKTRMRPRTASTSTATRLLLQGVTRYTPRRCCAVGQRRGWVRNPPQITKEADR